ncbi:MAG: hypothetical protein ACKVJU_12440 [Verrucomicrobiales bacterium]
MQTASVRQRITPANDRKEYREIIEHDCAVVGGGFAGAYGAKALLKHTAGRRVGIISAENHMTFQPMLPDVAGGSLAPRHVVNPIRRLAKGALVYKCAISKSISLRGHCGHQLGLFRRTSRLGASTSFWRWDRS